MASLVSLDGIWKLKGFDGQYNRSPEAYCQNEADERTFIDAQVPGEVHLDLERAGWIEDCNVGMNTLSARWVEEQVWVYRRKFTAPPETVSKHAWLVFDGLDYAATIYLNGKSIGTHANAFVPCRLDVTGKLMEGENVVAVRIESGLYSVSEKSARDYNRSIDHALHKRAWLRKPQYSFGNPSDFNPRLINVGIWRPVRLEWTDTARIDALTVYPELADDHKSARIQAHVFVESVLPGPTKARLRLRVPEANVVVDQEVELAPGPSRQNISAEIANPRLWWPRPHGDQPLYTVECELEIAGKVADSAKRRTGIRSIRINRDPHPEVGEYFTLEVNGRKVFAKGANWVPPDMIYARPDAAHYRKLVQLAVDANFNMFRVWGGGTYVDHAMLDACDEMGVMVWQEFIFAISKYPADDPEFLNNVRGEVTFVVRDLSQHPSLVVWCGNNEIEWGTWSWGYDRDKAYPDYALFHLEIPRILKREDPSRPYWPSSPYAGDGFLPNDPTRGDQHRYEVTLGAAGPNFWEYRKDVSRFVDEAGLMGGASPATIRQFIPEKQRYLYSPVWEHHDNGSNSRKRITYKTVEYWLGRKAEEMKLEDYLFYSALLQAEGLQEFANNLRRRMFSSSGAVFWQYNDSWPMSHGWSIVDYYLRRKLAYYTVRRAYADIYVVPVVESDRVAIYGINDTPETWQGEVRYGVFGVTGGLPVDNSAKASLAPNAATVIGEVPLSKWESIGTVSTGAFALLIKDGHSVAQNRVFVTKFNELPLAKPQIAVKRRGDKAVFSSPTYVWGTCLDVNGEAPLSDDVFDLLPGIEYEIEWPAKNALPRVERCGSALPWR